MDIKQDQEIQVIEKQVPEIVRRAESFQIIDERTSKYANDLAAACKKTLDKLEDKRKFFVKPLQEHVKAINEEFRRLSDPLSAALAMLKGKLLGWCQQVRKAEEEELKAKNAAATDFLGEETPTEPVKAQVKSQLGATHTKKVWSWKVIDETQIAREYLMIDEKKINAILRGNIKVVNGISTCVLKIAGIEIYQKDEIAIRT